MRDKKTIIFASGVVFLMIGTRDASSASDSAAAAKAAESSKPRLVLQITID